MADAHRLAAHLDPARVRMEQPVEDAHQGGLAGAVLAHQRVDLAGLELERDVVLATTSPKRFVIPFSSSSGASLIAGDSTMRAVPA